MRRINPSATIYTRSKYLRNKSALAVGPAGTAVQGKDTARAPGNNDEYRLKKLVDSVTNYIYSVKLISGCPVSTTHCPGCVMVTGYTSEEFRSDPEIWYKMIHEEDRQAVLERIAGILSGTDTPPFDHRIYHKNGSIRWVRNTPVLQRDSRGRPLSYDGLITDITEWKKAEEEIGRLNQYIMRLQEAERQMVSKDLHDGVGQTILAAKLNIDTFKKDPVRYADRLDMGLRFISKASQELREICMDLYPSILNDLGLEATIRWYAKNALGAYDIATRLSLTTHRKISHDLEVNIYRIIQEIFSNILKHSGADSVSVSLSQDGERTVLVVEDDGIGFSLEKECNTPGGHGLWNVRQRTRSIGGECVIDSRPGAGTVITIIVREVPANE